MSCVAKHHRSADTARTSAGARTPVDVWLRRQMKADHDADLREQLPAEWTELAGLIADRFATPR